MNRLLKGRGKILAALFMLSGAVSLPAWGESYCTVSATDIPLKNVNLKSGNFTVGDLLYTSQTYSIPYTCVLYPAAAGTQKWIPSLAFTSDFSSLVQLLDRYGLGIKISINGDHTATSSDIVSHLTGGRDYLVPFGEEMAIKPDPGYNPDSRTTIKGRMAEIVIQLYATKSYPDTAVVQQIPGTAALYISPATTKTYIDSKKTTSIHTGSFSIRILPDNLGRVDISPRLVQLGRFYTTDISKRSQPFTVTAQQNNNANVAFSVPLRIRFEPQAGLEMTADKTAVKIKNTGDTNDNGLQLSIEDTDSGKKVVFGEDEDMGIISMGSNAASGQVLKRYVAVLDKIPGVPDVITGKFEVSGTVVVTYN